MPASSITVAVRVRPFNQRETAHDAKNIVIMSGNSTKLALVRQGKVIPDAAPREFSFDYSFWTHKKPDNWTCTLSDDVDISEGPTEEVQIAASTFADQGMVFRLLGRTILNNVLEGYNACLFAYGQTGSGKTYSMIGNSSDRGIIPRIGQDLFKYVEQKKGTLVVTIEFSVCEIYNEDVRDLLVAAESKEAPKLKIRQHAKLGIFVEGLSRVNVKSGDHFTELLERGLNSRTVSATMMNATSSRSHAVALVTVTQTNADGGQKAGKISLVDLAGSERTGAMGLQGSQAVEGANINQSLSTLGMCLSRLAEHAEGKTGGGPVPFRDSSLTYLLSDNLAGNSKTAMIAALSPADLNYEETLSTLRFASVVKKVKTVAVVNEHPQARLIRELRAELAKLKDKLKRMQDTGEAPSQELVEQVEEDEGACDAFETTELVDEGDVAERKPAVPGLKIGKPKVPKLGLGGVPKLALGGVGGPAAEPGDEEVHEEYEEESETEEEEAGPADKNRVFVDWKAPHLINLSPDRNADILQLKIKEGESHVSIAGHGVTLYYNSLQEEVRICGEEIYHNGALLLDEGTVLRHNDRVEIGDVMFRFAHARGLANNCDFDPIAKTIDHCLLLERHRRFEIHDARSKDAMSIARAFYNTMPRGGSDESEGGVPRSPAASPRPWLQQPATPQREGEGPIMASPRSHRTGYSMTTPRTNNPAVSMISEDIALYNLLLFRTEGELVAEYPARPEVPMEEEDDPFGYLKEEVTTKDEQLEALKKALHEKELARERELNRLRQMAGSLESEQLQALHHETCAQRSLKLEVQYHHKSKVQSAFHPHGPDDPVDAAAWKTFYENPPFLSDPDLLLEEGRFATVQVKDFSSDAPSWNNRFICCSRKFLFFFPRQDGRERLLLSVYLTGCQIGILKDSEGRTVLQLVPACPRCYRLRTTSREVHLYFGDEEEMGAWKWWLENASMPSLMPLSLLKRKLIKDKDKISQATIEVEQGTFNTLSRWKADERVAKCEECTKEFSLFRRRHHCRMCGGIFCKDCLAPEENIKICRPCSASPQRGGVGGGFVEVNRFRRCVLIVDESTLKNPSCLQQDFLVRFKERNAEEGLLRVDLYQGRVHTWVGDDIRDAALNLLDPSRLDISLADGSAEALFFQDSVSRQRCMESIMAVRGTRMFVNSLDGVVESTDIIIQRKCDERVTMDCLVRGTCSMARDISLWIGRDDGRPVPFHNRYCLYVFTSVAEDPLKNKTLALHVLAKAPLALSGHLYVVSSDHFVDDAKRVTVVRSQNLRNNASRPGFIGVSLHIQETSVLFCSMVIPAECDYLAQPTQAELSSELASMEPLDIPEVDALQQYDNVFIFSSPFVFRDFQPITQHVQMHSSMASLNRRGRTSALVRIPTVNFHFSELQGRSTARPTVCLKRVLDTKTNSEFSGCKLFGSLGFDRVPGPREQIIFASSLPESLALHYLYVAVPSNGTAAFPIAQLTPDNSNHCKVTCELQNGGTKMGEVELTFEYSTVETTTA